MDWKDAKKFYYVAGAAWLVVVGMIVYSVIFESPFGVSSKSS